MAATFSAMAVDVTWSTAAKSLLTLYNGAGSGVILRVYRAWMLQTSGTAATGILIASASASVIHLVRTSNDLTVGATTLTPIAYDTNSAALPAQVTCRHSSTTAATVTATFRKYFHSSDEPAASATITSDELQTLYPLNVIWDSGYGTANVEPIVLREGEGLALIQSANTGGTAAGRVTTIFEFTVT